MNIVGSKVPKMIDKFVVEFLLEFLVCCFDKGRFGIFVDTVVGLNFVTVQLNLRV